MKLIFEKNFDKILCIIFTVAIVVDNINGFFLNQGVNYGIGQICRLLIIFILYLFSNGLKNKVPYANNMIFVLIYLISISVLNGFRDFNVGNIIEDILYSVKLIYPFIIIICVYKLYINQKISKNFIDKMFNIYSIVAPISIILPTILNIGYNSYTLGGVKGFYYANNEINIVLLATFIYTFDKVFNKFSFKNLIYVGMNLIALLLIGSKTSLLITALTVSIYFIKSIKTPKKFIKYTIFAVIGLGLCFWFLGDKLYDSLSRIKYFYTMLTENGSILDFLTSTRNKRILPIINQNILNSGLLGIINLLIGIGRSRQVKVNNLSSIIEMDFFDTIVWYGLIIGFIILIWYLIIIFKSKLSKDNFVYKYMTVIIFIFSIIAGHVWYSALSSEIFSLCLLSCIILSLKGEKKNENFCNSTYL